MGGAEVGAGGVPWDRQQECLTIKLAINDSNDDQRNIKRIPFFGNMR